MDAQICTNLAGWLTGPISSDLCNNIVGGVVGGVVTSAVVALIALGWRRYHQRRLKEFGEVMATIITHKNEVNAPPAYRTLWLERADQLEKEAIRAGYRVSQPTGRLIDSLGELVASGPPPSLDTATQFMEFHWWMKLTTVISRMRDSLQRHDR